MIKLELFSQRGRNNPMQRSTINVLGKARLILAQLAFDDLIASLTSDCGSLLLQGRTSERWRSLKQ